MKQPTKEAPQAQKPARQGGRPHTRPEEQRTVKMVAYFDPEAASLVRGFCQATGRSISSYLYEAAVEGKIAAPLSEEDAANLRKLAGMANNVNQMAKQANTYGYADEAKRWEALRDQLASYLHQIQEQCSQR